MCKHILIRDFSTKDIELVSEFTSRTHDRDGFGAIIRDQDGGIHTLKSLDIGAFYLDVGRWIQSGHVKDLVLHHRTSTNGAGLDYAHPFEFRGNYLTHNGVVSVPGSHDTKTQNDSEALLHHLIKTDFDTAGISGYFSCFIFNAQSTTVLVDDSAPIYSDGRVFSSHRLVDSWLKIEKKRLVFDLSGNLTSFDIALTKSDYGYDKAHLSLGWDDNSSIFDASDVVDDFLRHITAQEEMYLSDSRSRREFKKRLKRVAADQGLILATFDVSVLAALFGFEGYGEQYAM